jgi:pimeloyl-ACP methyl ester carboxylesterase
MTDFLLVHGAWHGGWCWNSLAERLRAKGCRVVTPTLTGLADRSHLLGPDVTLETHITDVVNTARWLEMDDFVLCGHSYGGMVISGAAEHLADRLRGIVFVDAFFPANGQSCSDIAGSSPAKDSEVKPPPVEWFDIADPEGRAQVERLMTPHPANTMLQPVGLTGARERVGRKTYVLAGMWKRPYFVAAYEALSQDPAWRVYKTPTGHHPMLDAPDQLTEILLEAAG